jgi:L-seryl-tRNA(Ser) seleniumtransferase
LLGESLLHGASVVTASGDKLLGGPQAGLILGKADMVNRIAKHPLARTVRIDKLTLAGLVATLQLYVAGREDEIPVWKYVGRSLEAVEADALELASARKGSVVESCVAEIGGGSLPGSGVPSFRCGLNGPAEKLARALRLAEVAVIPRIEKGRCWLDPRTMEPEEVAMAKAILRELT